MKIKYVTVNVQIDPRTGIVKDVLMHEVGLLKMKHGENSISLYERQTNESREIADFEAEFDRCIKAYGYTSNDAAGVPCAVALWGNASAGGPRELENSAKRKVEDLGLLRHGMSVPTGEAAETNDAATSKIFKKAPKSKANSLNKSEMASALEQLDIEFSKSMKADELKIFGEQALKAKAHELGLETEGMGASDLFDAIVEAS